MRYYWWKKAVKRQFYEKIVAKVIKGQIPNAFLFDIGKGFKGLPGRVPHSYNDVKNEAVWRSVIAYQDVRRNAEKAAVCWMLIANRFKRFVAKDVAKIIGRMLLKGIDAWRPEQYHKMNTGKKARN